MKKQLRALGDFWREEYGRWVGMTAVAFLVLVVLSYIAGRLFPEIPAAILTYFNEVVADSGIVRDDGSFSALALFGNNLRAMVLSTLYGFIPFLYLPALSMGVNAILLGMVASSVNGQWLLLAAGILPHGIFELPALCLSLAAGLCLCQNINRYIRKNEKGIMKPLLLNILRVTGLVVIPLLVVAAIMESYVTPAVMQLFM
ncbi:MAG: stage II sporulation protein M [Oscillospiraceae bacterium]|mgnify:FL=1|nr:stage II sporulation protein M [Oscillospiraceae bacterium]